MSLLLSTPIFSSLFLFITLLLLIPAILFFLLTSKIIILEWVFFSHAPVPISITFIIDSYRLLFSFIVLFISANVIIFSHSYIAHDPFKKRFTYLVLLFILSINFLIFIPNLITLLLGWDGLGLTSFLLVIYYRNAKRLSAGIITALTNRIGDVLLLLSIALALNISHWNLFIFWHSPINIFISFTILVATITKSAQIPFSRWLPAAIAAPTPVSALVHSSTLVTAGVFLLIRFFPFLRHYPYFSHVLLFFATLTTLIAGLRAITECDIKKIIALSTLSQLGVIIIRLGINIPALTFFHLLTHALFKALLFLCAGTLINLHQHSQDLRTMGHIATQIPLISSAIIIANLALSGAPFLAGFYSKDIILEFALYAPINILFIILFFFATALTASYTTRFLISVIWNRSHALPNHCTNDSDYYTRTPTFLLRLGAIIGGRAINWLIILPSQEIFLPINLKLLTMVITILGFYLTWSIITLLSSSTSLLINFNSHHFFLCTIWFLTPLSSQFILPLPIAVGHYALKTIDQGWVEFIGGQGALFNSSLSSSTLQPYANNLNTTFFLLFIFSIPILIVLFLDSLYKA